jgi:hypothetical protein
MRSTALKMFTVLLGSVILLSTSSFKGPEKPVKPAKYTGHWISLSGGEYYEMGKADISEDAFEKDSKGKITGIDHEKVKSKFNYKEGSKVNGKNAEKTYFVIGVDESSSENATNTESLVSSYPRLLTANCTVETAGTQCNYVRAIYACMNYPIGGWTTAGPNCIQGNNGYCLAYKVGETIMAPPYMYYILCSNN